MGVWGCAASKARRSGSVGRVGTRSHLPNGSYVLHSALFLSLNLPHRAVAFSLPSFPFLGPRAQ